MKEFQPSLFDTDEQIVSPVEPQKAEFSGVSLSTYNPDRHYSDAALDQGWGWRAPDNVDNGSVASISGPEVEPEDPWRPPTEAEEQHIRSMIEATKARLRQNRQ